MSDYGEFIQSKSVSVKPSGFSVASSDLHPALFGFQRAIVARALHQGKFCNGSDTGLGKTIQSLAWADKVASHTQLPVLILAPLAVSHQFEREGQKFSVPVKFVSNESEINGHGIYATNYEKLHRFGSVKCSVVLDEGSILKAFDGKTSQYILARFNDAPFKLSASATFAPNDLPELGMQSEFLGVMSQVEMQSEYFVHDGGETSKWRLKKWGAQDKFWEWLSSWCCLVRKPSDIGPYNDIGYDLPGLNEVNHAIESPVSEPSGVLPGCWVPSGSSSDKRHINKSSLHERCQYAADLILSDGESDQWVVWCNSNAESELLASLIPHAVEVAGKHTDEYKVNAITAFQNGDIKVIVTKDKIFGFGINLQNCHNTIVFPNDSYERYYQLVRRFYRFGQKNTVNVHRVFHRLEGYSTMPNLSRKSNMADEMFNAMLPFQRQRFDANVHGQTSRLENDYNPAKPVRLPQWIIDSAVQDIAA